MIISVLSKPAEFLASIYFSHFHILAANTSQIFEAGYLFYCLASYLDYLLWFDLFQLPSFYLFRFIIKLI